MARLRVARSLEIFLRRATAKGNGGFLAASTVRLLSFDGAATWAELIDAETEKDVTQIRVGGVPITVERARRSCEIVAHTLVATRMRALNNTP